MFGWTGKKKKAPVTPAVSPSTSNTLDTATEKALKTIKYEVGNFTSEITGDESNRYFAAIQTYTDKLKELKKLFHREYSKTPEHLHRRASILMRIMHAATSERDLRAIPDGHYEKLKGDRKGQSSLQLSGNWRLCFVWDEDDGDVYDLEIVDYH